MISNERLREMASPTWRFVGDEYRQAIHELLCRRERTEHKPLTVGTTTKYPDMPFAAYEKLRLERDGLLVELKRVAKERYEETIQRLGGE